MDNKAVRKANVAALVRQYGGPTAFGEVVNRRQAQVSQWLGTKPIGDRVARDIERALGKAPGWLDHLHSVQDADQTAHEGVGKVPPASHSGRWDSRTMTEALKLLDYDEAAGGDYTPEAREQRLWRIYEDVLAQGGFPSVEYVLAFSRAAEVRQAGDGDGAAKRVPGSGRSRRVGRRGA